MKKDPQLQAEAKAQFFEYGRKLGTRDVFLDYVWNVVFGASMGYSFSQIHSYAYSIIALQELNLNYFYPKVYWNCACLSCEALGLKDNEDGSEEAGTTDYGEIAKAIYKMKQSGIEVSPPSINKSGIDFTPIEEDNLILFGLGGIASINRDVASQIIQNRPYNSFVDFYQKNVYTGSLVTPTKIVQLIKAGCFDDFETDRVKVMKQYVVLCVPKKQALTLANLNEALKVDANFPKDLIAPYLFKRYVCTPKFFYGTHPNFKTKKLYWLDEKAQEFFNKNCRDQMTEGKEWWVDEDRTIVIDKELDKFFASTMNSLKDYINSEEFLRHFNNKIRLNKFYEIAGTLDVNHWAMEACSYYPFGDHELAHMNFDEYNIEQFSDLSPEPLFIERSWGKGSSGRTWKQYEISAICGTVLARNDNNHLLTILTPENIVVNIKFNGEVFAYYKSQLSEVSPNGKKIVHDKPWFKRGELLIVTGYRRGDDFIAKRYKTSVFPHQVQKIARVMPDGTADIISERWGENSL